MQTINFIVNCLLPNSADHLNGDSSDFEQRLINIIDKGCSALQNQGGESLSKYCLNNLFELCRVNAWPDSHQAIRQRIALMTTPILVNRCKLTLLKFVSDEKKSGSVQLARVRVNEVQFILSKLQMLESNNEK
jgi:hypothetical protein